MRLSVTSLTLWLALAPAAFQKILVARGVSLFDIAFGIATIIAAMGLILRRGRLSIAGFGFYVMLLTLWSGVVGIPLIFLERLDAVEFLRSWSKLTYFVVGAIVLAALWNRGSGERIKDTILSILALHAVFGIYVYVAQTTGLGLPYEFLWTGQEGPLKASYFRAFGAVRSRGLFSEPSYFAIFQSVGLAILLLSSGRWRPARWKVGIVLLSTLLTFSLGGLAILLAAAALYMLVGGPSGRRFVAPRRVGMTFLIIGCALALLWSLPVARATLQDAVIGRITDLLMLQDRSGTGRLLGAYETVRITVETAPLTGSGLGGLGDVLREEWSTLVFARLLLEQGAESWNMLAYVFGTLGVIGVLLVIGMLWRAGRNSPAAAVVFVSMFASGSFLGPLFWLHVALVSIRPLAAVPTRSRNRFSALSEVRA